MNSYLSRLNPAERRFVVFVGLLLFVVINLVWVRPHFSDWGRLKKRLNDARVKENRYQAMIQQIPTIQANIKKLEGEGTYVPPEDTSIQFLRTIQVQASQSGVGFIGNSKQMTSTNQFFLEQSQTIQVAAGEKALVDFLFNLGSGSSLIRVREISVRPDANRIQLSANVTLVASYQKKKPSAEPTRPAVSGPGGRPAAQPASTAAKPGAVPPPPGAKQPTAPKPAAPKPAAPNKK